MSDDEEVQALVVDNGSGMCKVSACTHTLTVLVGGRYPNGHPIINVRHHRVIIILSSARADPPA